MHRVHIHGRGAGQQLNPDSLPNQCQTGHSSNTLGLAGRGLSIVQALTAAKPGSTCHSCAHNAASGQPLLVENRHAGPGEGGEGGGKYNKQVETWAKHMVAMRLA